MGSKTKADNCPADIDPSSPLDALALIKTVIVQSNELYKHGDPKVMSDTSHADYVEIDKVLRSNLHATLDCIAQGKVFKEEFYAEFREVLEEGIPMKNGAELENRARRELEKMAHGGEEGE